MAQEYLLPDSLKKRFAKSWSKKKDSVSYLLTIYIIAKMSKTIKLSKYYFRAEHLHGIESQGSRIHLIYLGIFAFLKKPIFGILKSPVVKKSNK